MILELPRDAVYIRIILYKFLYTSNIWYVCIYSIWQCVKDLFHTCGNVFNVPPAFTCIPIPCSVPTRVIVCPVQSDIQPDLPSLKHHIVPTVAAKMKPFGIFLGVENTVVDKVMKNNPNDCERACEEMLKLWLANDIGTGKRPRTWATVISAFEEAGYREQAIALRRELNERDSPV